ncbi:MAG: Crp/Fnr family transcriptional regulator [Oscillospiraceae bacterium]|nr:Crp/Fnr family transcriptional regulator [Oscillospiraceae bacterium]
MYYDSFTSPEIGMPREEFAPFFTAGVPREYRKGQLIYLQGSEPEYLYCLLEGTVRTYITSDQGDEKLLTTYRAGSVFGEASFFDGMPRVSTATAQTPCKIVRLSRPAVDQLLRQYPELASSMITYLARTVRLLSGHVDTMSFQSADRRLANLLLNHPTSDGAIHQTHEELATALGVSRVTVSRILSSFAKAGYIRTGYGAIIILDRQALADLT